VLGIRLPLAVGRRFHQMSKGTCFTRGGTIHGNGDLTLNVVGPALRLRVRFMHQPGSATGVVQVFSLLGLQIEELSLRRHQVNRDEASLHCVLSGDEGRLRLVAGKLQSLLCVLEVEIHELQVATG